MFGCLGLVLVNPVVQTFFGLELRVDGNEAMPLVAHSGRQSAHVGDPCIPVHLVSPVPSRSNHTLPVAGPSPAPLARARVDPIPCHLFVRARLVQRCTVHAINPLLYLARKAAARASHATALTPSHFPLPCSLHPVPRSRERSSSKFLYSRHGRVGRDKRARGRPHPGLPQPP